MATDRRKSPQRARRIGVAGNVSSHTSDLREVESPEEIWGEILAGDEAARFVAGIYNYCDRWCQRCLLRHRCLSYALSGGGESAADEGTSPAVVTLLSSASDTLAAARAVARHSTVRLAGLTEVREPAALPAVHESHARLLAGAERYAYVLQAWFDRLALALASRSGDDAIARRLGDACAVLRRYQTLIPAKVFRALIEVASVDIDLGAGEQRCCDGSIKVALLCVEASVDALRVVAAVVPDSAPNGEPRAMLTHLRDALEQEFPAARRFVRPGFDTDPDATRH